MLRSSIEKESWENFAKILELAFRISGMLQAWKLRIQEEKLRTRLLHQAIMRVLWFSEEKKKRFLHNPRWSCEKFNFLICLFVIIKKGIFNLSYLFKSVFTIPSINISDWFFLFYEKVLTADAVLYDVNYFVHTCMYISWTSITLLSISLSL